MTPNRLRICPVLFALLAIGLLSTSCVFTGNGGASPESEDSAGSEASATGSAEDEVAYEPAYPEEVSDEGLTEEDTAQQETAHSHDGEGEHSHGPDSHSDGTDHEHDDHDHDGDHDPHQH